MLDLIIAAAGVGVLAIYLKNRNVAGSTEPLKAEFYRGSLSPQVVAECKRSLQGKDINKVPPDGFPIPHELGAAFEDGLDYRELAGKVDPDTYSALHKAYWYGRWTKILKD
ncbi:MAG: hypothetical protein AB1861_08870 [Cyanobacteriota bacterium]